MIFMRNPNGYGSIVKLSGARRNPFAVRITAGYKENGTQIYKYLSYHPTRKDAMISLAKYNERPYNVDIQKITFLDVYEKWANAHFEKLSESSIKSYKSSFNHCKPIYNKSFQSLNTAALQTLIDNISAPSAKHHTKIFLKQLYKYAMKYEIADKDYSALIDVETPEPKQDRIAFTESEIETLWKNKHLPNVDIILMLIYSGFRITELLELKKENIHLQQRYIVGGKKTRAGIDRIVPIHKRTHEFFENRLKEKYLFTNLKGGKMTYNAFLPHFHELMETLSMKHYIHDTRHTFITNIRKTDANDLAIKRIVGHATDDITDHYTHKEIKELIHAMDKLK